MMELSVIIPVLNESNNIGLLIKEIKNSINNLGIIYEIIVVDGGSKDGTVEVAQRMGVKAIIQNNPGFGNALLEGFRASQGEIILTLDADFSHSPDFIPHILDKINEADVIIASRYVKNGSAKMSLFRYALSRLLNLFFKYGLSLPVNDITSGFRIYKRKIINSLNIRAKDFNVLPEILIEAYAKGFTIKEIPFHYAHRKSGTSHLRILKFAIGYLKLFLSFWKKRNSIIFSDYDERGYYSKIFLQRYWQRRRYNIIMSFLEKKGLVADLGCGSSKIIQDLPEVIAVDMSIEKMRYIRKSNKYLVNADVAALPFKNGVFSCVICSEVVEHIKQNSIFEEISRILQDGGILILGTPDYGRLRWRIIEFFYGLLQPGGYKDKHITKYDNLTLNNILTSQGFKILIKRYICGSELILKAKKIAAL